MKRDPIDWMIAVFEWLAGCRERGPGSAASDCCPADPPTAPVGTQPDPGHCPDRREIAHVLFVLVLLLLSLITFLGALFDTFNLPESETPKGWSGPGNDKMRDR